jgi:hypothetical protein
MQDDGGAPELQILAESTAPSASDGSALHRHDVNLLAQSLVAQIARMDDETQNQVQQWLARWGSGGEQDGPVTPITKVQDRIMASAPNRRRLTGKVKSKAAEVEEGCSPQATAKLHEGGEKPSQDMNCTQDWQIGDFVRIATDGASVLAACRAVGIGVRLDKLRLAALGSVGWITRWDLDGTVLCEIPKVGEVWFPLEVLRLLPEGEAKRFKRELVGTPPEAEAKAQKLAKVGLDGRAQANNDAAQAQTDATAKEDGNESAVSATHPAPSNASFKLRVMMWVRQCLEFHKMKKTWSPGRPCCFVNCMFHPSKPTRRELGQTCYGKLSRQGKLNFRGWVESGAADACVKDMPFMVQLLHPEEHKQRPSLGVSTCKAIDLLQGTSGRLWGIRFLMDVPEGTSKPEPPDPVLHPETKEDTDAPQLVHMDIEQAKCNGKRVVERRRRESGVRGIHWSEHACAWKVEGRDKNGRQFRVKFSRGRFMTNGRSSEEAADAALQAAIARQNELFKSGFLAAAKKPKPLIPQRTSHVAGVSWHQRDRTWWANFSIASQKFRMSFRPKDSTEDAIRQARLAAESCRRSWEIEHLGAEVVRVDLPPRKVEELFEFTREDHETGISWMASQGRFEIQVKRRPMRLNASVRPNSQTKEGFELARARAVRVRDALRVVQQRVAADPSVDVAVLVEAAGRTP